MRTFLASILALALLWAAPALAASPTIDASGVTTASFTGATGAVNITTTSANDSIVVAVMNQYTVTAATVNTITDSCGLTFNKQASIAVTSTADPSASNIHVNMEIWTASASATKSACALTVNLSAAQDGVQLATFGVTGLNSTSSPLDTNGGAVACTSATASDATKPTLTTSQANDLLVGFGFMAYNSNPHTFTTATWGAALYNFTYTSTAFANNSAAAFAKSVSATQSGTSVDISTAATLEPVVKCGIAFTADAAVVTTNHNGLLLTGVGE